MNINSMDNLFTNISDYHKDLIIKKLSGNSSYAEVKELNEWIAESEENLSCYHAVKNTWHLTGMAKAPEKFNAGAAWKEAETLFGGESVNVKRKILNPGMLMRIAAIFILAFLIGGTSGFLVTKKAIPSSLISEGQINEIVAPLGSRSQVSLPDGTIVWLNAGSRLRYSQAFNANERNVDLEGEAYFNVKTNPSKPFVVNTPELRVKAFGTAFNVKAYPEEKTVTTTLVEGTVKVESTTKAQRKVDVTLKPRQNLTYVKEFTDNESIPASPDVDTPKELNEVANAITETAVSVDSEIQTNLYTSWKDERWIIDRVRLDDLAVMLERRFNVQFIFNSEDLEHYTVSGTIRKETIEQVMDLLKLTTPLNYNINEYGVVTLDYDSSRSDNYLKVMD